jgi:signal transduction histidine kinase
LDVLKTFAAQLVVAIQNAALFREIGAKNQQLAEVSQHKSQAPGQHELRAPHAVQAILGYTELIVDDVHRHTPPPVRTCESASRQRQAHLLNLTNDVFHLSKIDAGQPQYGRPVDVNTSDIQSRPLATSGAGAGNGRAGIGDGH